MLYNCMKVVSKPNQPNQWLLAWILIKSVAIRMQRYGTGDAKVQLNCVRSLVRSN